MSDSATLEKVVNEIIIDKGWDKEFIKKGEELGLKNYNKVYNNLKLNHRFRLHR